MRQYHCPSLGKVYVQFAGAMLYYTALNMVMSVFILWQTTVAGWASVNLPWLTLPVFLVIALLGVVGAMVFHWVIVERGRNTAATRQAYLTSNPAVRDLQAILQNQAAIMKKLGIEDDNVRKTVS
jgi:hypothetical protein